MKISYKTKALNLVLLVELGLGDSGDWNRWMEIWPHLTETPFILNYLSLRTTTPPTENEMIGFQFFIIIFLSG